MEMPEYPDAIYVSKTGTWTLVKLIDWPEKYHHARIAEALKAENEQLRKERDMNAQHIGELAEFIKNSGVNTAGVDLSAPAQYLCSEIAKIQIAELKAKLEDTVYELASCKGHNEGLKAKLDKAKDALEFYADSDHNINPSVSAYGSSCEERSTVFSSLWKGVPIGQRARKTLEELK